jgi:hypothetical protein
MAAPLKCLACNARWWVSVGMGFCPECGCDDVDVDTEERTRLAKLHGAGFERSHHGGALLPVRPQGRHRATIKS